MARPRSLTPDTVAAAALAVVDRDGLAALTMRAVAAELGMGTMSLYRYVRDRDELEGLLVDRIARAIDPEPPARASWRESLAVLVERAHQAVRSHPSLVPLLLTRRHASTGALRWGEAMMRALSEGGFEGARRVVAFRTLLSYVMGAVQVEHFGPLSGEGTAALARLPAADHPFLRRTARHARAMPVGREFRAGLDVVLRGLDRGRRAARRGP